MEAMIEATQAFLPGNYSTFNYGPNKPDPADQDKPWIRTDNFGNFDRVYTFNGLWLSPNPTPPSGLIRHIWKGSEADLWAYDGGDGSNPAVTVPTETTGVMWQVDHDFDARMPIGAGALPSGATIGVGATGGEEKHALTSDENGPHIHTVTWNPDEASVFAGNDTGAGKIVTGDNAVAEATYPPTTAVKINSSGLGTAHNNLSPYKGVYLVKRSARKFYTVP